MYAPFTPAWAAAFRDAINADAGYREAARGWPWPVALVLDPPAPAHGHPAPVAVQVALDRGTATDVAVLPGDAVTADFVFAADWDTWAEIVRGALDPFGAVMSGRLRLVRGSLMTLMTQTPAARALVACAAGVPTDFGDGK